MLKVREIMTQDVVTVSPEMTLREAMDVLVRHHVSGAPVVANSEVLGVVTSTDLLALAAAMPGVPSDRGETAELEPGEEPEEWDAEDEPPGTFFTEMWSDSGAESSQRIETPSSPEWNALEEQTVADAMTRWVFAMPPEASVTTAAEMMGREKIHRVLVMDGDRLLGIVSASDITKAVAENKLVAHTYVFEPEPAFDERGWKR